RTAVRARSPVGAKYDTAIDRESAFEKLAQRATPQNAATPADPGNADVPQKGGGWMDAAKDVVLGTSRRQGMLEAMAKSMARNAGGQLGRSILRGVLGSITRR
ncbi:MAG: helicase HerA-like domain-containing protein, partial [Lysobacterales bacterium]